MNAHRYRLVALLAAMNAFAPAAARADGDAADATKIMPSDAATHGQPMKMDEVMPTKMKKDGMTKAEVMKGEKQKGKVMDDALKQEESTMKERH